MKRRHRIFSDRSSPYSLATVVPIYNVELPPNTDVEFGGGVHLTATPEWLGRQELLDLVSAQDREAVKYSSHAFIVAYDAGALGEPDPAWTGNWPKPIQQSKYELCVLGNLALWLSKPSPVCFSVVIHGPQFGDEPIAQQIQSQGATLLCHPQDLDARITESDLALAQTLHTGLVALKATGAVSTAVRATWAGLQTNIETIRYALFWIALEALFGPEDSRELSYRLCQRIGLFLGGDKSEAKGLFNMAKKGYTFRSKIVHGRWKEDLQSAGLMADVEALVRQSLTRVVPSDDLRNKFSGPAREGFLDTLVWSP